MIEKFKKWFLYETFLVFVVLFAFSAEVFASGNTLTVGLGADAQYNSIQDAINNAQDGDTIEIISNVEEANRIDINKNLIIIARGQVQLTANRGVYISENGQLTLGNGSLTNNLDIISFIENKGVLIVKDGFSVRKKIKNYDQSTYQGEGGSFFGGVEIAEKASVKGKITGGVYQSDMGDVFDVYGTYSEIAGGQFRTDAKNRGAVYVQGTLEKISGGEFLATYSNALSVQHGGTVVEITGGNFKAPAKYAVIVFAGETSKAHIGTISGGNFEGDYAFFINRIGTSANVSVGEISGGKFIGTKAAVQVDRTTQLDKISGGTFISKINGIVNAGTINTISGGYVEAKYYGILNHNNMIIDTIEGGVFNAGAIAIYNKEGAVIRKIKNGVFYGKDKYAYYNLSDVETLIEPDLSGSIGNGRYWGGIDAIKGNVVYPDGFHMSSSDVVLPVDEIQDTSFRYLKKLFTLSYDANGGVGNSPKSQIEEVDDDVLIVADNPFTYEGKKFVGWNTKADGSGKMYQPSDEISLSIVQDGDTEPLGDTILFAQWVDAYGVKYDSNGSNEPAPTDLNKYNVGDTITLTDVVLTKNGYKFKGWSIADKEFKSGASFVLNDDMLLNVKGGNLVFVAVWQQNTTDPYNNEIDKPNPTPTTDRPSLPSTGQDVNIIFYSALFVLSGCGIAILGIIRKKEN